MNTNNNDYVYPTSNGFDRLEGYMQSIYGPRGSFENNMARYIASDEVQHACRAPKTLEEIPEITFENIKAKIQREEYFQRIVKDITENYWKQIETGNLSDEDYQNIGGIMGVCPGDCNWTETLFPHVGDFFVEKDEQGQAIWKKVEENANILNVMVDVMMDGLTEGQIIESEGRYVYSQGYARNYFRGENAYYGQSKPSMYRNISSGEDEKRIDIILSKLRICEFVKWLHTLDFVNKWPYGDIFNIAIAQHYGIPTNVMDVTSDIKVAVFFACCKYENGQWRPLKPEEYELKDSRENIKKYGGDSRYGILFQAPADVSNMSMYMNSEPRFITVPLQIGYHPFLRSGDQHGYLVPAGPDYDMYKDMTFQKFKFRLTPEICDWIYNEMEQGTKIYSNKKWEKIEDITSKLLAQKQFSESSYDMVLKHLGCEAQKQIICDELRNMGIEIVENVELCDQQRKREIEKEFEEGYEEIPVLKREPRVRLTFSF